MRKVLIVSVAALFALMGCTSKNNNETGNETTANKEIETTTEANKEEPTTEEPTTEKATIIPEAGIPIPEGAEYYIAAIDTTLVEGIEFPEAPANGDKYTADGYVYTYYDNFFETKIFDNQFSYEKIENPEDYEIITGWNVVIEHCTDTEFNPILGEILGQPVTMMVNTFEGCLEMYESPDVPDSVILMYNTYKYCNKLECMPKLSEGLKYMWYTFNGCDALTKAGNFPENVVEMRGAFYSCNGLLEVTDLPQGVVNLKQTFKFCELLNSIPTIPASVKNMEETFYANDSLKGWLYIDANPDVYTDAFWGVDFKDQSIVLTGNSELLKELTATSQN